MTMREHRRVDTAGLARAGVALSSGRFLEVTRGNLLIIPDKRAGYAEKVLVVRSGIENRADTETTVSRPPRLATPIGCCPLHSQPRSETDAW